MHIPLVLLFVFYLFNLRFWSTYRCCFCRCSTAFRRCSGAFLALTLDTRFAALTLLLFLYWFLAYTVENFLSLAFLSPLYRVALGGVGYEGVKLHCVLVGKRTVWVYHRTSVLRIVSVDHVLAYVEHYEKQYSCHDEDYHSATQLRIVFCFLLLVEAFALALLMLYGILVAYRYGQSAVRAEATLRIGYLSVTFWASHTMYLFVVVGKGTIMRGKSQIYLDFSEREYLI